MSNTAAKPSMKRFEPKSGWSEAGAPVISINDYIKHENQPEQSEEALSAEALVNLGESIQDVFNSLKINDPRLQAWTQVHAAIRLIGGKLQEKHLLEEKLASIKMEIEGVRTLASELVINAYKSELEVHATSKLRVQIAETLNEKLTKVLKTK
jgi:hypothetical protein